MNEKTNKLIKGLDVNLYRQFKSYCVSKDITLGKAFNVMMSLVLHDVVYLEMEDGKTYAVVSDSEESNFVFWPEEVVE